MANMQDHRVMEALAVILDVDLSKAEAGEGRGIQCRLGSILCACV